MAETRSDPAAGGCMDRLEEVSELFAAQAIRVRRIVHLRVTAPDALVEDACQVAWARLVVHRARVRRETADRWLVTVAVRELLRALARERAQLPLESLDEEDPRLSCPAPDLLEEVAPRDRLASIGVLPERQQRLVWLQGLGFSYAEIAGATGDSRRTVERQLVRARRTLAGDGS